MTNYQITAKMRRDMGVCVRCGRNDAVAGSYCADCKAKNKAYREELKRISLENHLCPICGKRALYGDEKTCLECKAHKTEYNKRYFEEHKDVFIAKYYARNREHNKKLYADRKAKGLCPKCGRTKAKDGFIKCEICREHERVNAIRRAVNE